MREEILRILKSLLGDQVNFAVTLQNLHTPPPFPPSLPTAMKYGWSFESSRRLSPQFEPERAKEYSSK